MAKAAKPKKEPKPKKVSYTVSLYEIHVKGPDRNKAFGQMLDHLSSRLVKGQPLTKADRFGTVIRSIAGKRSEDPDALELSLVKYNSRRTGLSWNLAKSTLVQDQGLVTAQRTELVLLREEHVAILVHKPHGPSPSQIQTYLEMLMKTAATELELDCTIDVLPQRVGGTASQIKTWRKINRISVEFFRPNPSGAIHAELLKNILDSTDCDKGRIEVEAKKEQGLKYSGIAPLVSEGEHLVTHGQGNLRAAGVNQNDDKEEVDSTHEKVRKVPVITTAAETRSLAKLFFESLTKFIL